MQPDMPTILDEPPAREPPRSRIPTQDGDGDRNSARPDNRTPAIGIGPMPMMPSGQRDVLGNAALALTGAVIVLGIMIFAALVAHAIAGDSAATEPRPEPEPIMLPAIIVDIGEPTPTPVVSEPLDDAL